MRQFIVFVLLLGFAAPALLAQSVADIARQERERRAAADAAKEAERLQALKEMNERAKASQPAPPAPKPAPKPRNTAGFQDCGTDMTCFTKALAAGKPAFVKDKKRLMDIEELTYYTEISQFKDNRVSYYIRLDDARVKYNDAAIQQELKNGSTRAQVAENERLMNEALQQTSGNDATCIYKVPKLTSSLKEWVKPDFSVLTGLQLMSQAESCTGPMAEGIDIKNGTASFESKTTANLSFETPSKAPASPTPGAPAPHAMKSGETFRTKLPRAANWRLASDGTAKVMFNAFLNGKKVSGPGVLSVRGEVGLGADADEVEVKVEGGNTTIRFVRK